MLVATTDKYDLKNTAQPLDLSKHAHLRIHLQPERLWTI